MVQSIIGIIFIILVPFLLYRAILRIIREIKK